MNTSRTYRLTAPHLDALALSSESVPPLAAHEVLVRMRAASLNYKDNFYLAGAQGIQLARPTVPLSDGAGDVVAVGERVTRFAVGDRVAGNFVQDWLYGPLGDHAADSSTTLGHGIDGTLAEYRVFSQEGLVALPNNLSYEEAATLPCAARLPGRATTSAAPPAASRRSMRPFPSSWPPSCTTRNSSGWKRPGAGCTTWFTAPRPARRC